MLANTSSPQVGVSVHPYYPLGVVITDYVAKTRSTPEILAIFVATCTSILAPTWLLVRRNRPTLPASELATVLWFVLCGSIHIGLEGQYLLQQHT